MRWCATVNACADRGVEYLTVFAFSSENWKRPSEEVSGLMGLVLVAVVEVPDQAGGEGVRIRIVGDRDAVSDQAARGLGPRRASTAKHNTRITLSVAFNYGGRWDIVQACAPNCSDGALTAKVNPEDLDEDCRRRYMALADAPDPDLFIRTGGEVRISNFLLWQLGVLGVVLHRGACGRTSTSAILDAAIREPIAAP